jgi:hypothetical protein
MEDKWEDNIKMDLKGTGLEDSLAEAKDYWQDTRHGKVTVRYL